LIDAEEVEWYIPVALSPTELQGTLGVIRQYTAFPFELDGNQASALLTKQKARRRRRRSPSPATDADDEAEDSGKKARKEKRKKEKEEYKSAAMIIDSDEEYGDMDAFLEKEKAVREKAERVALEQGGIATMKPAGTKKRRRKAGEQDPGKKKRKSGGEVFSLHSGDESTLSEKSDIWAISTRHSSPSPDTSPQTPGPESARPKPRPRPKPRYKTSSPPKPSSPTMEMPPRREVLNLDDSTDADAGVRVVHAKKKRIVISDDE
jgi:replication fork protection complex subunit Tof1/Swi1